MKVVIEGRLPGTNELVSANRNSWQRGSSQKKNYTLWCEACIKKSLRNKTIIPPYKRVDLYITWYEMNARRDPDNIIGGLKYLLDGAVKSGAIPDDSQKYIRNIHSFIEVDKKHPRVEVEFKEVKDD